MPQHQLSVNLDEKHYHNSSISMMDARFIHAILQSYSKRGWIWDYPWNRIIPHRLRLWSSIVGIALISPFSWQCQNLFWLTLASKEWRVVMHVYLRPLSQKFFIILRRSVIDGDNASGMIKKMIIQPQGPEDTQTDLSQPGDFRIMKWFLYH